VSVFTTQIEILGQILNVTSKIIAK